MGTRSARHHHGLSWLSFTAGAEIIFTNLKNGLMSLRVLDGYLIVDMETLGDLVVKRVGTIRAASPIISTSLIQSYMVTK